MKLFTVNGNERILSEKAFLVSETDEKGNIVFANDDFCKIADFSIDELIGKAHSIVRHSEMPHAAFKDLWDTVKRGEIWTGFVKNKVKGNTQFYWVYATVYPIMRNGQRHYISCRRKPAKDEIEKAVKLYKTLS